MPESKIKVVAEQTVLDCDYHDISKVYTRDEMIGLVKSGY